MSLSTLLSKAYSVLVNKKITGCQDRVILFFSSSDGKSRADIAQGSGDSFQQAWRNGSQRCQTLARQKKIDVSWLRIDWVTSVQASTWGELEGRLSKTKRNYFRFGLALDAQLKYALIEPEINANAMLYLGADKVEAGLNDKNFTIHAKRRFGQNLVLDFSADAPVWIFTHQGAFFAEAPELAALPSGETGQDVWWLPGPTDASFNWKEPACLNAGRRQIRALQVDDVFSLIRSSSVFLSQQVKESGQFVYGHFPCFGRTIAAYNALRHASTIYSMLEGWELTRDDVLLAAIQRALGYLVDALIHHYPQNDGRTLAFNVDINGEIKLGANAVALLALVKYDELTGDTCHRPLMEQLALGIASMQDPDSGKFIHVLNANDLSIKENFRIVYYDGEAAFGLMRLYGLTKNPRWLDIVQKAFEYFITADHWKHHDHWLSYCVNEITIYKPEEKYFRFGVKNIADYLDFILRRETTFPTLLELSMAFEAMLHRIENDHPEMRFVLDGLDMDKFYLALHHRAHFLLNGFFWPELAMYYANPASIVGSFFIRHHAFRVRIDDVEHYLSGCVAYWKMLKKRLRTIDQEQFVSSDHSLMSSGKTVVFDSPGVFKIPDQTSDIVGLEKEKNNGLQTFVIAWGGDVNLGRRQHYKTAEFGFDNVLNISALKEADISIVNLECVVATGGEQGISKGEGGPYYYRARPEMLHVLKAAGVDMVATANNHSGDYGPQALMEQRQHLDSFGIAYAGSGNNRAAAFMPVFRHTGDLNIAFFSVDSTQHRFAADQDKPGSAYLSLDNPKLWRDELAGRIADARNHAHIVLVAVHWGSNHAEKPSADEISVGRMIIDSGADAVLGASAHRLQGIEIYQNRPIIYDAGDLLFDSVRYGLGNSGVFQLEVSSIGINRVIFVPIGVGFGFSKQHSGVEAKQACLSFLQLCKEMGTDFNLSDDGTAFIDLEPPARAVPAFVPTSLTHRPVLNSNTADPIGRGWVVHEVPEDARMDPLKLGPLTLVGLRVKPREITQRRMLWVESFWQCDDPLKEDFRLSIMGSPILETKMSSWGLAMDHDPCDWMMPTSQWQPGVIYRDYYGLRPPYLKDWENIDLQLSVGVIGKLINEKAKLPVFIKLAIPGKEIVRSANKNDMLNQVPFSFSSTELSILLNGYWENPPKEEIYIDYFVSGMGLVEYPRTCVVCMFYDTWIKGTGNSGHYKNIFSDTHNSFFKRYTQLKLQDKINCLIVQRPIPEVSHIPQFVVKDSYDALKTLAYVARRKMGANGTIFAITGAVGKSTTTDLLATGLRPLSNCIAMTNGHNSRTGVSVWTTSFGKFSPEFEQQNDKPNVGILEVAGSALWMSTGWVMKIVKPNISIITHIALTQYNNNSRTLDDVAKFKSRVCESMYPNSKAVLYREMPLYNEVLKCITDYGVSSYSYGKSKDSDAVLLSIKYDMPTINNKNIKTQMEVSASILGQRVDYKIGAIGEAVALNSIAALTAAKLAGFDINFVAKNFFKFKARKNTLDVFVRNDNLIIDCSHNLEIPSILFAFDILKESNFCSRGRKIIVISRIVNMGDMAQDFHYELRDKFFKYGFDAFFIHNPNHEWDKFLSDGGHIQVKGVSDNAEGTVNQFINYIQEGDTVLIMGAPRGCDFGKVLPRLLDGLNSKFK
ncbi:CapA family protein [Castellaniella sp.]|uniref:CapA family protein n=1 Tax=Castellaniella sp. TaxID=1955812 RepID=UPI002B002B2E|nr:CapA family protein [Castellaniella sp.]